MGNNVIFKGSNGKLVIILNPIISFQELNGHLVKKLEQSKQLFMGYQAIIEFKKAIQLNSSMESAHFQKGNLLSQLGRVDEAIQSYQVTVQLKPDLLAAHNNLGVLFLKKGKFILLKKPDQVKERVDKEHTVGDHEKIYRNWI